MEVLEPGMEIHEDHFEDCYDYFIWETISDVENNNTGLCLRNTGLSLHYRDEQVTVMDVTQDEEVTADTTVCISENYTFMQIFGLIYFRNFA